jgi:AbrB family looped-hinge helix DNA binding protein
MASNRQSDEFTKGQLVIPAKLREEMGFKPGVRVVFTKQGNGLLIESGAYEAVMALRGKYAGIGLEESFAEDRRLERELEDKKLEALYEMLRP